MNAKPKVTVTAARDLAADLFTGRMAQSGNSDHPGDRITSVEAIGGNRLAVTFDDGTRHIFTGTVEGDGDG